MTTPSTNPCPASYPYGEGTRAARGAKGRGGLGHRAPSESLWLARARFAGARLARARFARAARGVASALAIAAMSAACVDSPTVTALDSASGNPLADTFDALSKAAGEYGDLARSDGFTFAALSVRSGVTPSRLEVQAGASVEPYDAFVSSARWDSTLPMTFRPPARRSLIAWRRLADGTTRILTLTTPSDSAPILSPLALGVGVSTAAVFAGASAMYHDVQDSPTGQPDLTAAYYGTTGWVKLREVAVIGSCPDSSRHRGELGVARCEEARYQVRFDVSLQRLLGRPPTQVTGTVVRRLISVGETLVNGLRLSFTCAAPSSRSGCNP